MKTTPSILSKNDARFSTPARIAFAPKAFALLACTFLFATADAESAVVIDNFSDTSHLSASAGSASFDISSGGLVVTPAETSPGVWGAHGGQAIFFWSMDGGRYAGFSLDPDDEQYIFSISGAYNVTPAGRDDAFIYAFIYFFGGGIDPEPQTYYISDAIMRPVGGEWSINVLEAASSHFGGSVPDGLKWTMEIYIASGGQEGVGYRFGSMAAIPEPGTVGLLAFAGGLGLCYTGLKGRRGVKR